MDQPSNVGRQSNEIGCHEYGSMNFNADICIQFHLVGCCLCGILKIFGDSKQHRSPWRQLVYWVSWEYQTQVDFTFEHQKHVICAFKKNRSSLHRRLVWLIPSVPWSRTLMNVCTGTGAFWRWQHVITSITKTLPSNQFDDWTCRLWRTEKEMLRGKSNINIGNFQLRGNLTQSNISNNDYTCPGSEQQPLMDHSWGQGSRRPPSTPNNVTLGWLCGSLSCRDTPEWRKLIKNLLVWPSLQPEKRWK